MAFAFGTHSAVAAFMIAFRFAHLLRRLFGDGAMHSAFIPYFEKLKKESPKKALYFYRDLSISLALFLFFLILIAIFFIRYVSLLPTGNNIYTFLFIMLPSLLFICLFGLNCALLQCYQNFFISSAAPAAFNCIWIFFIALLSKLSPEKAMLGLSVGTIFACIAQWAMTLKPIYKLWKSELNESIWANAYFFSVDVKKIGKPLLLGSFGIASTQINSALDPLFSIYSHPEGPAYLWYAIRLQQAPLALLGIALSTALFPPLARAAKEKDWKTFWHFTRYAWGRSFITMLPFTLLFIVSGTIITNTIYGHGSFSSLSTIQTTYCLWGYTIGLLPMALIMLMASTYYARGDYKTPSIASAVSIVINIFLNTLFVVIFKLGPWSVALTTSISSWIQLIGLLAFSKHANKNLFNKNNIKKGLFFILKSSLLVVLAIGLKSYLFGEPLFSSLILNSETSLPQSLKNKLIYCFTLLLSVGLLFLSTNLFETRKNHSNTST